MQSPAAAFIDVYARHLPFLIVWFATPLLLIAAAVRSARPPTEPSSSTVAWRAPDVFAAMGLFAFFAAFALVAVWREDLVGTDYAQLTADRFFEMPIWPSGGRFFPLAMQEYNLLGAFGKSAFVYHTLSVAQLLVVAACVVRLLDPLPRWFRAVVIVAVATVPSVSFSFLGLVFPERDLIFWFALWLVLVRSYDRDGGAKALCGAVVAAQFALYYKETAFVLVGGFAGTRLIVSAWRDGVGARRMKAFARAHVLELAHLALCAVFLAVYWAFVGSRAEGSYAVNAGRPGASLAALSSYLALDPLLSVLALALVARGVGIVTRRRAVDLFWDPLAAGALLLPLAYVKLAMVRDYYLAPTDFIAVLYLSRFSYLELRKVGRAAVVATAVAALVVVAKNFSETAYNVVIRKDYVHANARLVSALERYATTNGRSELSLFFPQVGGFQLMEFSSYLQFKGFRVAGGPELDRVLAVVKGPHQFPNDLCFQRQAFRCAFARAPSRGDLVVLLPGRHVSAHDLETLKGEAKQIAHIPLDRSLIERALATLVSRDRLADAAAEAFVFEY